MQTEEYYCTDNFFKKMTDMESPRKNNDCYFYYYSTCSKGDSCGFRHEPSALGCETMCSFWKEGKCLNIHCNFRHMELRKNRKAIPCYWESQPGGCLKPHCPFMHQSAPAVNENEGTLNKTETGLPENCTQASNFKSTSSVDSLVVNFEEESDTESAPSTSPAKIAVPKVKTLEEIKLEKIAAACAEFYFYPGADEKCSEQPSNISSGDDLRQKILQRAKFKEMPLPRKLSADEMAQILGDATLSSTEASVADTLDNMPTYKKRKLSQNEGPQDIKIKTLEELRAERKERMVNAPLMDKPTRKRKISLKHVRITRNVKLNEISHGIEEAEVSSTSNDEPAVPDASPKAPVDYKPFKPLRILNMKKIKASEISRQNESNDSNKEKLSEKVSTSKTSSDQIERHSSNKPTEESLLMFDDTEDDLNVTMRSEDDLLNEIDNMLND